MTMIALEMRSTVLAAHHSVTLLSLYPQQSLNFSFVHIGVCVCVREQVDGRRLPPIFISSSLPRAYQTEKEYDVPLIASVGTHEFA